jgi:lysosomal acid lipase/cholesteryl ester hydrolase
MSRHLLAALAATALVGAVAKDPDEGLNMTQLVQRHGYPIEEHFVETADGYILGVFRIPHGRNSSSGGSSGSSSSANAPKMPVLLQHALLDSSFAYVANLPNESLGYILADAGYDVWLPNNRGNKYSTNHTHLDVKSREFWQFTYDDMALSDLPAEFDYILGVTGAPQLSYLGHSEGTIQAFAGFSQNKTLASLARVFIALAPVAYVKHLESELLKIICDLHTDEIVALFGDKAFLPRCVRRVGWASWA